MKPITIFEADDGSRWDDADAALNRDAMHRQAMEVELPLGKRPKLESNEFVQHNLQKLQAVKRAWKSLAKLHFGTTNGRVVADSNNPVSTVMYRLMCIDDQGREWQQVYYAQPGQTPANPVEKKAKV